MTKLAFVSLYFMTLSQKNTSTGKNIQNIYFATFFCRKENVIYICTLFLGRLAQLVQSIWFTPRGSGVRIPHRPQTISPAIRAVSHLCSLFISFYSQKINKYYIGFSSNVPERLCKHNRNSKGFSSAGRPWIIINTEPFDTKKYAMKRENNLKNGKTGNDWRLS